MKKVKKEQFMCCAYCNGVNWCIRSEKKGKKYYPFVYPCPMCNPHQERPPIDVDRNEINELIEKRKKIVPKNP